MNSSLRSNILVAYPLINVDKTLIMHLRNEMEKLMESGIDRFEVGEVRTIVKNGTIINK